jgi:hypothetical protein
MPEGVGYGPQSTASTGLNLNVIGNHAYAYSGQIGSSGSAVTHLAFTTGNYYVVGRLRVNGAVDVADTGNGRLTIFSCTFNGEVVSLMKTETLEEDMPNSIYNNLIIPPYTVVEITAISDAGSSTRKTTALITGEIYRKID